MTRAGCSQTRFWIVPAIDDLNIREQCPGRRIRLHLYALSVVAGVGDPAAKPRRIGLSLDERDLRTHPREFLDHLDASDLGLQVSPLYGRRGGFFRGNYGRCPHLLATYARQVHSAQELLLPPAACQHRGFRSAGFGECLRSRQPSALLVAPRDPSGPP